MACTADHLCDVTETGVAHRLARSDMCVAACAHYNVADTGAMWSASGGQELTGSLCPRVSWQQPSFLSWCWPS